VTAPTPAPVVLLPLSDDVLDQLAERLAERLPRREPDSEGPLLLTSSKLCRKLGVSRASVYRWRGEGMPAVKCGDEHRYILAEVLGWLRGRG
jgi:hypothetical protein